MKLKSRRLILSDVLLIAIYCIIAAIISCFLFLAPESLIDAALKTIDYMVGVVTGGFVFNAEEIALNVDFLFMLNVVFTFNAIVLFVVSLIVVSVKKTPRYLTAVFAFILSSLTVSFGLGFVSTNMTLIATSSNVTLVKMSLAGLVLTALFVFSLIALVWAFIELRLSKIKECTCECHHDEAVCSCCHHEDEAVCSCCSCEKEEAVIEQPKVEKIEEAEEKKVSEPEKVVEPAKKIEPAATKKVVEPSKKVEPSGLSLNIERVHFAEKLKNADKELKVKYNELREYLLSFDVKNRVSVDGDSYRAHTVRYCLITIAGKKMKVYFKLDYADYKDSPLPLKDASGVKKYADVPVELDVKSDLSLRRAMSLVDDMMKKENIAKLS